MASYPGAKVHRSYNRRKLGRGQSPAYPSYTFIVSNPSADVLRIVSVAPVVWHPLLLAQITAAGATFVSAALTSSTQVDVTFSGSIAAAAWVVPQAVGSYLTGGVTPPSAGTF